MKHTFWTFKYIHWKVCSETSQLYMQHWDNVLLDVWELFQQWDKDFLCYAIFNKKIMKCIISTLKDSFSQNYFMKLLYKLFSQSYQKLSESSATYLNIYQNCTKIKLKCVHLHCIF